MSLTSFPFSGGYSFHIVVTSSDAPDLALTFQFCGIQYDFVQEDCCEKNAPPPPAGAAAGLLPHNDDLFYEEITYHGLDISRIEIGSDCSLGYMRNDFSYDTNHRVTRMLNTFFNPDPIAGRYNTSYEYDKAGNITGLNRYGLIDASAGQYTYGLIDSLVYTYANDDSRLSGIEDFVADPLAELKGFKIAGAFGYDGNGNFTSDGDQGLAIASNLINLPRIVASPSDSLLFEYTFGGEKIRKLQTSPVARDRIYLGGAEFVNDTLELYHHAEGRVVLSGVKPAFQYRIADHLGNTVVFFEDRDGDTKIKTESMTSDPDSLEVLQRNYYYPFGLEMEGPWQAATAPRADYLYNGKELEEDLKLNWYAYGFRYYDPSIGRFTGVDPIAEIFPDQSPYLYAYNAPVRMVDVDGLYGDEGEANKQRQAAVDQGLKVGDSYQSGDDWGFNVVNGENSYSAFKWDFAGENEAYAQLAERDFVPGLGNVEGNYGNQNTVEALGCFAHLSADVLEIVILTQGGGAKNPKGFNPALPKVAAKGGLQYSDDLVKAAQKLYPNKAGKIELHHPIPQYLGGAKSQKLVPLDGAYHQQITNEFRRIHPYGSPKPSPQRIQEIMNEVYSKFPLPGQ